MTPKPIKTEPIKNTDSGLPREAKRQLNISWEGVKLNSSDAPVYCGVTLDPTLSYKQHCIKTKLKILAKNNILVGE